MYRRATWLVLPVVFCLASLDCVAQRPSASESQTRVFTLTGSLRFGDSGQAAEMIKVDLKRFTGETVGTAYTRSTGDFEFSGLSRGSYILVVEEEGYEPIQERVEILNSDRRGVMLNLTKGVQFEVRQPGGSVSARELQLPPKAREAYQKGTERLYAKKDPKGSLAYFQRVLEMEPTFYEAYFQMGVGYLQMEQPREAETAFRESIQLSNGGFAESHIGLAAVLCDAQKFAECEASARRGVELDANSWQGHFQLARGLLATNQLEGGESALRAVVKLKPDHAESYLFLANIYIRRKNYPALLKALDEYLRLEPNGPMSVSVRETRDTVAQKMASGPNTQGVKQKP